MKMVTGGSCALLLALTTHGHALKASSSCESLSSLALPNTSITLAQVVPAGAFTLPGTGPAAPQFSQLPTFCRVAATLTPSADSDIKIEVWLPTTDWNGKFQAVGNGGWAGTISYGALASALQEGYATASTNTGHAGANASFAIGHPEKVIDFAYRAVHEMAVKSKAISQHLLAGGLLATSFSFPVVPEGAARIRFQVSQSHSEADLEWAAQLIADTFHKHGAAGGHA